MIRAPRKAGCRSRALEARASAAAAPGKKLGTAPGSGKCQKAAAGAEPAVPAAAAEAAPQQEQQQQQEQDDAKQDDAKHALHVALPVVLVHPAVAPLGNIIL